MSQLSDEQKTEELMKVHEKVKILTGEDMELFRPPYGDYDDDVVLNATKNGMTGLLSSHPYLHNK